MTKWIYRIFSDATYKTMISGSPDHLKLSYRWPFDWNPGSSYTWDRLNLRDPNIDINVREKHLLKTSFHIGNEAIFLNNKFSVLKPMGRGVHDPLEGYVLGDRGFILDDTHIYLHAEKRVSEKIRALCFSTMEGTEEQIIESIEKTILDNNCKYGSHYMYAKYEDPILFRIIKEIDERIGVAVLTPWYFNENGIQRRCVMHELKCGFNGGLIDLLGDAYVGTMSSGDKKLEHHEMELFKEEITMRSIPYKYEPVYGEENELRFILYAFDGWGDGEKKFGALEKDCDKKFWTLGTRKHE